MPPLYQKTILMGSKAKKVIHRSGYGESASLEPVVAPLLLKNLSVFK